MYIKHILSKYHEPIKKNHLHFILLLFKKLEPRDQGKSYGLEKNHTNKKYKIQNDHVMVFACKYFNSIHKHISHLNILTMNLFGWPIIKISYQSF